MSQEDIISDISDDIFSNESESESDDIIVSNTNVSNIEIIETKTDTNATNEVELNIVAQEDKEQEIDLEIHMYKQPRGGKKSDTIITGLVFNNKDENKQFLTMCKKKFGSGGCLKEMPELYKKGLVFVFTGDLRDKIKNLLVNEYGKNKDLIKMHG